MTFAAESLLPTWGDRFAAISVLAVMLGVALAFCKRS